MNTLKTSILQKYIIPNSGYLISTEWRDIDRSDKTKIDEGEGISYEMFLRPVRNYYIFGDSGNWGQYSANDYKTPLDILIFKPEYASIFKEQFKQSKKEQREIKKWLPPKYRELIKL